MALCGEYGPRGRAAQSSGEIKDHYAGCFVTRRDVPLFLATKKNLD